MEWDYSGGKRAVSSFPLLISIYPAFNCRAIKRFLSNKNRSNSFVMNLYNISYVNDIMNKMSRIKLWSKLKHWKYESDKQSLTSIHRMTLTLYSQNITKHLFLISFIFWPTRSLRPNRWSSFLHMVSVRATVHETKNTCIAKTKHATTGAWWVTKFARLFLAFL